MLYLANVNADNEITSYSLRFENEDEMIAWFAYNYGENRAHWLFEPYYRDRFHDLVNNQRLCKDDIASSFDLRDGRCYNWRTEVLVEVDEANHLRRLDIRNYEKRIRALHEAGGGIRFTKSTNKSPRRHYFGEGRTHETHWHFKHTANFKDRVRRSGHYLGEELEDLPVNIKKPIRDTKIDTWDEDFTHIENNWKQAKCRNQWQWHKRKTASHHAQRGTKEYMRSQLRLLYEDDFTEDELLSA